LPDKCQTKTEEKNPSDNTYQANKNKGKNHRTTLIRQTKTKELIIGQHLSGKQKQKN
jgi:hypothetical protein